MIAPYTKKWMPKSEKVYSENKYINCFMGPSLFAPPLLPGNMCGPKGRLLPCSHPLFKFLTSLILMWVRPIILFRSR